MANVSFQFRLLRWNYWIVVKSDAGLLECIFLFGKIEKSFSVHIYLHILLAFVDGLHDLEVSFFPDSNLVAFFINILEMDGIFSEMELLLDGVEQILVTYLGAHQLESLIKLDNQFHFTISTDKNIIKWEFQVRSIKKYLSINSDPPFKSHFIKHANSFIKSNVTTENDANYT